MSPSTRTLLSLLLAALPLFGCSRAFGGSQSESETHFLSECNASCDDGLSCICGVCTRACEPETDTCSALARGATCTPTDAACGTNAPDNVCDVVCTGNADCSSLGNDASCVSGSCRREAGGGGNGGGNAGGSGSSGGGSSGSGNGGDGPGPLSCEDYADPQDPPAVPVTITNRRAGPIVLGGADGCQPDYISVTSLNDETPGSWHGSMCVQSCGTVQNGNGGCVASCPYPTPIVLEPGASTTVEWAGLVAQATSLPEECCANPESGCGEQCSLLSVAAPGEYSATVAYVDVSDAEAAACETDMFACPLAPVGGGSPTLVDLPFTLGSGAVALEIAGETSPALTCEALNETPEPAPVTITVTNRRPTPVVLDAISDCPDFFSVSSQTDATPGTWQTLWCGGDCASASGGQVTCGACETPTPIVLEPGEDTVFEWPGLVLETVDFPAECCDAGGCSNTCSYQRLGAFGNYNLNLRVADATTETAASCEADPFACPLTRPNGGTPTELALPFTRDDGSAVNLEITGDGSSTLACEMYEDPGPLAAVPLTITNRRAGPILVAGTDSCQPDYVSVASLNDETPGEWHGSKCNVGCGSVRRGEGGCTADCPMPTATVLQPGESLEAGWAGIVSETVPLPLECCEAEDGCFATECPLQRVAANGAYRATVAYLDLDEADAVACEDQTEECPYTPGDELTRVDVDFTLGSGAIELEIPAAE